MLFKEHSSDEDMGYDFEVSRSWSGEVLLGNTKEEERRSSFLGNSEEEEEVDSNENGSCLCDVDGGRDTDEFWELKLRISLSW